MSLSHPGFNRPLPTLLDIANHADVPIEAVVRTLMGQPVSEDVDGRVRQAVADLGAPHVSFLDPSGDAEGRTEWASAGAVGEVLPAAVADTVERTRTSLLAAFADAAAELEATLPQNVTSVVYEALRVEVEPMTQRVGQMGTLVEELTSAARRLVDEVSAERRERLEDVRLLSELIVSGWQSTDRRLGRIERKLERLERDRDRRLPF